METILRTIRRTKDEKTAAFMRILLGAGFLATGVMKFFDPWRGNWVAQLTQADIPFFALSLWIGPIA